MGSLCAAFPFGSRYCGVATSSRRTAVHSLLDKQELAAWNSKRVTAACAAGKAIVCAAYDGYVYIVREQGVEKLKHERHGVSVDAVAALDERRCVFGGSYGHLIELDLETRQFTYTHFADHGIPKPGRHIRCLIARENDALVLGEKELLVRFANGTPTSLHAKPPLSEVSFDRGVLLGDVLWMAGREAGPVNLLTEFDLAKGTIRYHRTLGSDMRLPCIANIGGRLVLENEKAYRGFPGTLITVKEFDVCWLLPMSDPNQLLAVGYKGDTKVITLPS